jgi:hypothetical protein
VIIVYDLRFDDDPKHPVDLHDQLHHDTNTAFHKQIAQGSVFWTATATKHTTLALNSEKLCRVL